MNFLAITQAEIPAVFKQLVMGMGISAQLFVYTLIFSMPLGLIVYFGKTSRIPPLRWVTNIYISVMRGTPLMLQLMVVFYGPSLIFHFSMPKTYRFTAAVVAFVINYAAYFAEIYRGGIESIPKGQYEAADILGYSKPQTFIRIVIPQMFKRVLPSITNEAITLVKDTSLAFTIGILEMFTQAKNLANSKTSMLPYVIAAVLYYICNYVVAFAMSRIEKKLSYYKI